MAEGERQEKTGRVGHGAVGDSTTERAQHLLEISEEVHLAPAVCVWRSLIYSLLHPSGTFSEELLTGELGDCSEEGQRHLAGSESLWDV